MGGELGDGVGGLLDSVLGLLGLGNPRPGLDGLLGSFSEGYTGEVPASFKHAATGEKLATGAGDEAGAASPAKSKAVAVGANAGAGPAKAQQRS